MSYAISVVYGSPRCGNSDKLAQAFISGAKEAGKRVHEIIIRKMKINGCLGCEYCYSHYGACVQKDDMQTVYNLLSDTETLVFATPIYYQGFPSQVKALIDRLYVTENRSFPIGNAALLATYATLGEEMSHELVNYYRTLISYHGWINKGIIAVSGLDEKDDIVGNRALMEAKKLGKKI